VPHRHHPATKFVAALFLAIGTFVLFLERDPGVKKLSAAQVADLVSRDSSVVLLDVRTPEEWNGDSGHLKGALLIPLADLPLRSSELEKYRGQTLVVYCRSGGRSGHAAKLLMEKGFNAVNMAGGIRRWNASGYAVVREGSR
jgi:rhodanese-related sulfurtransferase